MVEFTLKEQIQCSIKTKNLKTKTVLGRHNYFNSIPITS